MLNGLKTLSYAGNMLASAWRKEQGYDEALLVTPHGRVLEGPTWTFFWVADGRLRTPPLSEGILDSITRAKLLAACEVEERTCTLDDVRAAEEAFIASTVREVMPIVGRGRHRAAGRAGARSTRAAHEAFRALLERSSRRAAEPFHVKRSATRGS